MEVFIDTMYMLVYSIYLCTTVLNNIEQALSIVDILGPVHNVLPLAISIEARINEIHSATMIILHYYDRLSYKIRSILVCT